MKQALKNNIKLIGGSAVILGIVVVAVMTPNTPVSLFEEEPMLEDEPDAFVRDATYRTFDAEGNLESVLVSPQAKHYPRTDVASLSQPVLVLHDQGIPTWHVTSEDGSYDVRKQNLLLKGNVFATGRNQDGIPFNIYTEKLRYKNKSDFIQTDQPVKITSQENEITATGMKASIADRNITLLSNVKGFYVQPE